MCFRNSKKVSVVRVEEIFERSGRVFRIIRINKVLIRDLYYFLNEFVNFD